MSGRARPKQLAEEVAKNNPKPLEDSLISLVYNIYIYIYIYI